METIAPLKLADASWDNVGLLVESPLTTKKRVMLTIDFTEQVLNECIQKEIGVVVSYHPPIFTGMKRLNFDSLKSKLVLLAISNGISIYSPHSVITHNSRLLTLVMAV